MNSKKARRIRAAKGINVREERARKQSYIPDHLGNDDYPGDDDYGFEEMLDCEPAGQFEFDPEQMRRDLNLSESEIRKGMAELRALGLIRNTGGNSFQVFTPQ